LGLPDKLIENTILIDGPLRVPKGGPFNVYLCAPVLKRVWLKIFSHRLYTNTQWTVKVDPDAVFFPGRLRAMLAQECMSVDCSERYWTNWAKTSMHGPIEILSYGAVAKYEQFFDTCEAKVNCSVKGEDWCLHDCLHLMKVPFSFSKKVLIDFTYQSVEICGTQQIAFHPYKTWEEYKACLREAQKTKGRRSGKVDLRILPSIIPLLRLRLSGSRFTFIVNPGNAGDAMSQYGTLLLFKKLGLDFNIGGPSVAYNNQHLVYAGAGNLGYFQQCRAFLELNAHPARHNKILLLPATVKENVDDLLQSLSVNVTIVAREPETYYYLRRHMKHLGNVFLSKDMAFYFPDYDGRVETYRATLPDENRAGFIFQMAGVAPRNLMFLQSKNKDIMYELPYVSFDYRKNPNGTTEDVAGFTEYVKKITEQLMNAVSIYDEVYTNRMHICAVAAFLHLDTHCFQSRYWKNDAFFKYAIEDRYPNAVMENITSPTMRMMGTIQMKLDQSAERVTTPFGKTSSSLHFVIAAACAAFVIGTSLLAWRYRRRSCVQNGEGYNRALQEIRATPPYEVNLDL